MKRLFVLFVILAMAFVAMPAFATESIGPPGGVAGQYACPVDAILSPVAVQAPKEVAPIGFDLIAAARGISVPVTGLAFVAEKNALDKSLTVQSDNRPSLGAVA